jgi:hypothetical protein
VTLGGEAIGELEDDEWLQTVAAVDSEIERTLIAGLFESTHEEQYSVLHEFGSGDECLEVLGTWAGTHVPAGIAARLEHASTRATVEHDVRLRLLVRR